MLTSNVLDTFDRLDLPKKGTKLSIEPANFESGDGCNYCDEEKVVFEGGTHRVDEAEYDYLRGTYDNQICDVMLYDPADNTIVAIAYGLRLSVNQMPVSGETIVINITGSRRKAEENLSLMTELGDIDMGVLSGRITDSVSGAAIAGAAVVISLDVPDVDYTDNTDKDGNYLMAVPIGEHHVTVTKSGYSFAPSYLLTISANGETVLNVTGTAS